MNDKSSEFPFLLIQKETIQFNMRSDIWVDAWAFTKILGEAASHRHRYLKTCSTCAGLLSQACEIYRGDFLQWLSIPESNAFEEWATIRRVQMRSQVSEALLQLATHHAHLGDCARVQVYATRQLELDPLSEEAHYHMMRSLAVLGNRSEAITYFKNFSRLLKDELDITPSTEILNLLQRIQSGIPIHDSDTTNLTLSGISMPDQPMTGREAEFIEIQAWLENPDRRLITLTGPGGIGKTRLALAVALSQHANFLDGVVYVNLAHFSSANSFVPAVLEALHLSAEDSHYSEALLFDYFSKREILLILDDCECVIAHRLILRRLLEHATRLVVLVTSRIRLNLPEEWIFDLGGLEVPPVSAEDEIEAYSAVSLFVQSARRVRRAFELTGEDRHWVAQICRLVQGMPLAIVLSAPWVRVLSCKEIAYEIQTNLDFLAASAPSIGERIMSMRAVFDYSWRMLDEGEQRVFRRLSVFRGGFDRQAALETAGAGLEILANLVDQSLLIHVSEGRYDCHNLLRQYAFEKLVEAGEVESIVRSHFLYFLDMAELKERQLAGAETLQAFAWFIREQPNLLAAMHSALGDKSSDGARVAQRLEALLHQNWHRYGVHLWVGSRQ
ncbi:MAG TPA: BTAD domain-containing putative transcriptional regulator [Anaerolineales bacterium]|nr:BTAD domain-containing putative transcriptional regulator [Anaerolineales bacterium]